jgi:hypothetical protein
MVCRYNVIYRAYNDVITRKITNFGTRDACAGVALILKVKSHTVGIVSTNQPDNPQHA